MQADARAAMLASSDCISEKGVRLAPTMQAGPCIPVGIVIQQCYERLKLAQLLGQLGVVLTFVSAPSSSSPLRPLEERATGCLAEGEYVAR